MVIPLPYQILGDHTTGEDHGKQKEICEEVTSGHIKLDQYIATQGGQEQTKERTEHGCDHGVDERSVKSLGMNDGLIAI